MGQPGCHRWRALASTDTAAAQIIHRKKHKVLCFCSFRRKIMLRYQYHCPKRLCYLKVIVTHSTTLLYWKDWHPCHIFSTRQVLTSITGINELPLPPLYMYVTTITPAKPPGVTGGLKLYISSPLLWRWHLTLFHHSLSLPISRQAPWLAGLQWPPRSGTPKGMWSHTLHHGQGHHVARAPCQKGPARQTPPTHHCPADRRTSCQGSGHHASLHTCTYNTLSHCSHSYNSLNSWDLRALLLQSNAVSHSSHCWVKVWYKPQKWLHEQGKITASN